MRFVDHAGVRLAYQVTGSGPGVVIPWCNFSWADLPHHGALAERFTVVTASPRGYANSTRDASGGYTADTIAGDLLAVADAAGVDRFALVGYSLSAAVAAWAAVGCDRVTAVAAAGFPLLGSYQRVFDDVQHRANPRLEPPATAAIEAAFDGRAAVAFYRRLAWLPDGGLVDRLACPLFAYWGARDEIIAALGHGGDHLHAGLTRRHATTVVVPDRDHLGALLDPGPALPALLDWLTTTDDS